MEEKAINSRLDALEKKIDLILQFVNQQRIKSTMIDDLGADLAIIGKDMYHTAVDELDKRQVEIQPDEVSDLFISLLRNIENFKSMMNMFEMMFDLVKEIGPIFNEVIIDFTKQLAALEKKGYFEIMKEIPPIIDNIVQGLTPQDLRDLADNIMLIINTVKDMTQPDMLKSIDNAIKMYSSMDMDKVPSYSIWKVMREMNSPEMKKAIGFGVSFMKNLSQSAEKNKKK